MHIIHVPRCVVWVDDGARPGYGGSELTYVRSNLQKNLDLFSPLKRKSSRDIYRKDFKGFTIRVQQGYEIQLLP